MKMLLDLPRYQDVMQAGRAKPAGLSSYIYNYTVDKKEKDKNEFNKKK
jgi:hypothetical protein